MTAQAETTAAARKSDPPKKLVTWCHPLEYPFAVREVIRKVGEDTVSELVRVDLDEAKPDDRKILSFTFRRMRAGDPKRTEGVEDNYQSSLIILAILSGEDVEVIDLVDIDDFEAINEGVQPLLGKSAMKLAEALQAAQQVTSEKKPSGAT